MDATQRRIWKTDDKPKLLTDRTKKPAPAYSARETWLAAAMADFRPLFAEQGYPIPAEVRVSCGLPSSRAFGKKKRNIGETWSSKNSRDRHHEVFISPTIDKADLVLPTLAHELVHCAVGLDAGHKGVFVACARRIGLAGPWTSTTAGDALAAFNKALTAKLGPYPHGSLDKMTNKKKKGGTRLIKVGCPQCGYTTRITMLWIITGIPNCPNEVCERFGQPFEADIEYEGNPGDDDEGGDA